MTPVAHTFLSPSEPAYKQIESDIVRYDHDVRQAAQLLGQVGYAQGSDGGFRDGAGRTLGFEVRTDGGGGDDEQEKAALAVADQWKRFGIITEPLVISQAKRLDREYNSTFPAIRVWRLPNDPWSLDRYASPAAPMPDNKFNGGNRSRYMNPAFDALIDRYMSTIAEDQRTVVLGQIVHHMTDQVTAMGLWYNTDPISIGNRLRNVTTRDTAGTTEAWNAHLWDIR
jgi:ABC-type transport system substrate-binding protein